MSDCVFGIDPSLSGTAVCVYRQDGTHAMHRFEAPPMGRTVWERQHRYNSLCDKVCLVIIEETVKSEVPRGPVFIEGYSFASKGRAILTMVEFGWALRMRLLDIVVQQEVPPATLKQFVTGKGNADKLAVCLAIQKRYGVDFKTNDEFDSYALARMAACHVCWDEPANEAQRAALAVMRGEKPAKKKKPLPQIP